MDNFDPFDRVLDDALERGQPRLGAEVWAAAAALPDRTRRSRVRRFRWALAAGLIGAVTIGGTAAIAAPPLLQPMPGYTKLATFSYGVKSGEPGIRCQTIIAVKRLTGDPRYDAAIVTRFSNYMRDLHVSVAVPDAARQPYAGGASSTSTTLYKAPAVAAVNHAYSDSMQTVYDRFDELDAASTGRTAAQTDTVLGRSATIQDTVSCTGTP